jgi:hypothetical protein
MSRQHCTPLIFPHNTTAPIALHPLNISGGADSVAEAYIQELIHAYPGVLPIGEIDQIFVGPVSICRELNTPAGPIDNFLVTPSGLPVIVECKLWRNPQARREVVGQILDYAKELSRLSSSDLQRDVKARLKSSGNPLLELVRAANPSVDEADFNDALTRNLRRGRFLLLIVGDGIREGVEAIAEYLEAHAGLHFSLGLIELPIYNMPDGSRLAVPRVLLRTKVITRKIVELPDNYVLIDVDDQIEEAGAGSNRDKGTDSNNDQNDAERFWRELLSRLRLDDPDQPIPKAARKRNLWFSLPKGPDSSAWLTVYMSGESEVGIFLTSSPDGAGLFAVQAAAGAWQDIKGQLGGTAYLTEKNGRPRIADVASFGPLADLAARERAIGWLRDRINTFVNVLRPRIRLAMDDYKIEGERS